MGKTILGVDIGHDSLKLALCKNGEVKKTAVAPMPSGMVRDARVTSVQAVGELLRETMKRNHIRASLGGVVLANDLCFVRVASLPLMNAEQLAFNIPFEFNDYINDEPKNYIFDYAMLSDPKAAQPAAGEAADGENAAKGGPTMELMAVAAPKAVVEDARGVLSVAGLKMVNCAPIECAYISLLRDMQSRGAGAKESCILDLGSRSIRMFMFNGDRHIVTRVLEMGLRNLDDIVAEAMGVDVHLAHTYFVSNHEGCQNLEQCRSAYGNIATELQRALNFYRFSNQESTLADVWLCGGGASVPGLCAAIRENLDNLTVHAASEMVRSRIENDNWQQVVAAVGATME